MDIENITSTGIEENNSKPTPTRNKKVLLGAVLGILALLLVIQIIINVKNNFSGTTSTNTNDSLQKEQMINDTMLEAKQMGDEFYKAASNGDALPEAMTTKGATNSPTQQQTTQNVTATTNNPESLNKPNSEKKASEAFVTVNLASNIGRTNPFVPTVAISSYGNMLPQMPTVNYPAPPTELIQNDEAVKLMETTISGIMFDAISPSAIISVEGQDHLVRKGDRINGYRILNITKDRVIVQNGTNVYRATVGETLTTENNINVNNVYNLQHKFGGASAPKGTKMIEIN